MDVTLMKIRWSVTMQPDYELAEVLELTSPEQFKALGDSFRQKILNLLAERAVTTHQLAEALRSPNSTVAHHLNILTKVGLTKVVRTRQVRAITERYYGRVARTYISVSSTPDTDREPGIQFLQQILKEVTTSIQDTNFLSYTTSNARIPSVRVQEFADRVNQLAQEFEVLNEPGEQMYSFLATIYHSNLPTIKQEDTQ